MIDLDSAIAHAVLQRAVVLGSERRTRDAHHLMVALRSPRGASTGVLLGKVPREAEAFSLGARVRERADLRLTYLLAKTGRRADLAEAHQLASVLLARVGPDAASPSLDGDARIAFLTDLATALSSVCREEEAISLSEFLLLQTGAQSTDPDSLARFMVASPEGHRHHVRISQQLQNIALRRLRLAQLDLLAGETGQATANLAQAESAITVALRQIEDEVSTSKHDQIRQERLIRGRRAVLARVQLEQAMLCDPVDRASKLTAIRAMLESVVAETDTSKTSAPPIRLLRHAALAGVICEQALDQEKAGDLHNAQGLGRLAYILSAPYVALHEHDADERLAYIIRYAHACRLIKRPDRARRIVERSRERLSVYYGENHPAVSGLDVLLASF